MDGVWDTEVVGSGAVWELVEVGLRLVEGCQCRKSLDPIRYLYHLDSRRKADGSDHLLMLLLFMLLLLPILLLRNRHTWLGTAQDRLIRISQLGHHHPIIEDGIHLLRTGNRNLDRSQLDHQIMQPVPLLLLAYLPPVHRRRVLYRQDRDRYFPTPNLRRALLRRLPIHRARLCQ